MVLCPCPFISPGNPIAKKNTIGDNAQGGLVCQNSGNGVPRLCAAWASVAQCRVVLWLLIPKTSAIECVAHREQFKAVVLHEAPHRWWVSFLGVPGPNIA